MAYELIEERSVGVESVGGIERIYRCSNGYGALVYQEPPGSALGDRLLLTPVRFHDLDSGEYDLCSTETAVEGLYDGHPLQPRFLESDEDVVVYLEQLDTLPRDLEDEPII